MPEKKNERYDLGLPEYAPDRWPQSVKHYRIDTSFMVTAHNEKQALLRWREFQAVLSELKFNEWDAHDIVRYVSPSPGTERLIFIEEEAHDEMPQGGIASGVLPQEYWLDPYADDDFDPIVAAREILFGEVPDGEEIVNYESPLSLDEEVGPEGVIGRIKE